MQLIKRALHFVWDDQAQRYFEAFKQALLLYG